MTIRDFVVLLMDSVLRLVRRYHRLYHSIPSLLPPGNRSLFPFPLFNFRRRTEHQQKSIANTCKRPHHSRHFRGNDGGDWGARGVANSGPHLLFPSRSKKGALAPFSPIFLFSYPTGKTDPERLWKRRKYRKYPFVLGRYERTPYVTLFCAKRSFLILVSVIVVVVFPDHLPFYLTPFRGFVFV